MTSGDRATVKKILDAHTTTLLRVDLGCGLQKQPGFVGIDREDLPGVDIVCDLEVYPWPLPDDCVNVLLASHLVEHIDPARGGFLKFMDEAWRVMVPDGIFLIATPYAGSANYWMDPTHINGCTERTWAYFDPLEPNSGGQLWKGYKPKPWKIVKNLWSVEGILEVELHKRREDPSYYE